jgi:hypothetical protein
MQSPHLRSSSRKLREKLLCHGIPGTHREAGVLVLTFIRHTKFSSDRKVNVPLFLISKAEGFRFEQIIVE